MPGINDASQQDLPSSRTLLRSTVIAAVTAIMVLFTVVLPAEYGVDPTGVGRILGLKKMGEIKMALAEEAAAAEAVEAALAKGAQPEAAPAPSALADPAPAATAPGVLTDSVALDFRPGEGREIKLVMKQGARVKYSWATTTGVVNYDTHGDPVDAPKNFYHGYGKGSGRASDEGVLEAAFDGMHGWFWRNRGRQPLTVVLRVSGEYQAIKEIK